MNLSISKRAYFCVFVIAYISIALTNGDLTIFQISPFHAQVKTAPEKVASINQIDYLCQVNNLGNTFQCYFRTGYFFNSEHSSSGDVFQFLYWKNFCASTLQFLEIVNVKFEPTDIIFPFHFFW